MKIKFLGAEYPVVNVTFTAHGVAVTYFDSRSGMPGGLKLLTMSFDEFRTNASFLDGVA
jgi:hypothetical protein